MKVIFKYIKVIIFILSLSILFYVLKTSFDSKEFSNLIVKTQKKYLILCIFVILIEIILKAFRLKEISKTFNINYSLVEFIKIQTISISFSLITPGRIGEFTKIYLLNQKYKDKLFSTTFICIFERFFDIFILCFFSLILSLFILNNKLVTFIIVSFFVFMFLSIFFIFQIDKFEKSIKNILPYNFHNTFEVFILNKNKLIKKIPITILITCIVWTINSYIQLLILNSLGINANLFIINGINSIVAIMSILTILPLGLGTMDISALFLYNNLLGIKTEIVIFLLNTSRILSIISLLLLFLPFFISDPKVLKLIRKNKV